MRFHRRALLAGVSFFALARAARANVLMLLQGSNTTAPPSGVPVNTSLPTISGTPQVGSTLTAATGSWTNTPTSYTYQWQQEGNDIGGATASTYALTTPYATVLITVKVVATNAFGSSLTAISALAGPVFNSTVRYVSSSGGLDSNDGLTPGTAWQTLTKVNGAGLAAGTSVLFKRGDSWRDGSHGTLSGLHTARLNCASGTAGNPIHYDAYGSGANPTFYGSVAANLTANWTNVSGNIWKSNLVFQPTGGSNGQPVEDANDVSRVTWGSYPNRSIGKMLLFANQVASTATNEARLTSDGLQGEWYFDPNDWKVHIYSVGNPASVMSPNLELHVDANVIQGDFTNDNTIQNISIYNAGGHGIAHNSSNRIRIRDCIIGWIGGGSQGIRTSPQYGNGSQLAGGGSDYVIERCFILECWDGGITFEEFSGTARTFDNIHVRNNVVYNCPTCQEMNNSSGGSTGVMSNIRIYNNTYINPAGNSNREASNGNNHVLIECSGVTPTSVYRVKNNCFAHGVLGFWIQTYTWGNGLIDFNYNLWNFTGNNAGPLTVHRVNPPSDSITLATWKAGYTPAQEASGILGTSPGLVNKDLGDTDPNNLAPAGGSPLFNAGVNLFSDGVVWDFNKNPRPSAGAFTIGAFQ